MNKPQPIKQVHIEAIPRFNLIDITTTLPDIRQTIYLSLAEYGQIFEHSSSNPFRLHVNQLYDFDEVLAYVKEIL